MGKVQKKRRWLSVTRRAMRISVVEGAFATVHVSLTGGAFLTGFALMLGADEAALGVLAAIPYLTQVFQLVGAYVGERTGDVKRLAVITASAGRGGWLFALALPFIAFVPPPFRVVALIAFVALSSAFLMMTYNAWTVWMSELIPERLRGRYFGVRNVVLVVVGLVVSIAGGRLLDAFKAAGGEATGFAFIFGTAVACAAVGALLLARQPAVRLVPARTNVVARAVEPLADRNYRGALLFYVAWHFSWALPLAFWNVYMLEYLGMSYFQIAVFNGITSITAAGGHRAWGKVADRVGNKPVIAICAAGIGFLPLIWLTARPNFIYPIWFIAAWAGATWSGFGLTTFTLPLVLAPRATRNYYVAAFGVITGAATFLAASLGGVIAQALSGESWLVGGVTFINLHLLFLISAAGRFLSLTLLRLVREPRDAGVPAAWTMVRRGVRRRLLLGAHILIDWSWPWRRHG